MAQVSKRTQKSDLAACELLWEGKDEARASLDHTKPARLTRLKSFSFPETGGAEPPNTLIHGDNLAVMLSLLDKLRGKIKLIYCDPPFNVGYNFNIKTRGASSAKLVPAYTDTWDTDSNSYLSMIYKRLLVIRELLSDDGSLYIQCDYRSTAPLRLLLEEIFGAKNYINECIWFYKTGGMPEKLGFGRKHDTIHFVAKDKKKTAWNPVKEKSYISHKYGFKNIDIKKDRLGLYTLVSPRDVWDIPALRGNSPEKVNYPTQKPEKLLEKIIKASSDEGDLVADFFSGSGTTLATAAQLNRRWIGVDSSKLAIETSTDRMVKLYEDNHMLLQRGFILYRGLE